MSEQQTADADTTSLGREPKVIKRYANRKLYDTVESRYVTLEEIAEMVKAGAEVQVVDNRTKDDLTSVTLAQIIFEEEKKTSKMSLRTLKDLIRHGGERAQQFVEEAQADLRDKVQTLIPRGPGHRRPRQGPRGRLPGGRLPVPAPHRRAGPRRHGRGGQPPRAAARICRR